MQAILPTCSLRPTGPGLIWDKDKQDWMPTQKKETYRAMIDEAFTIADAMLEKDAEGNKAIATTSKRYKEVEKEFNEWAHYKKIGVPMPITGTDEYPGDIIPTTQA